MSTTGLNTRWAARAFVVFTLLFSTSALTEIAHAAPYDGTSPTQTGCSNSVVNAGAANVRRSDNSILGFAELRYSSVCKTTWARFTTNSWTASAGIGCTGSSRCASVILQNLPSGSSLTSCVVPVGSSSCFTTQYGSPRTTRAFGSANNSGNGTNVAPSVQGYSY
jgi:Protein of unknown function (DUF2690)